MIKTIKFISAICATMFASVFAQDVTLQSVLITDKVPADENPVAKTLVEAVPQLENLSLELALGFETEYIYRGKFYSAQLFQPQFDISYAFGDSGFSVYTTLWGNCPITKNYTSDVDFYYGLIYNYDFLTVDFGSSYFWYTEAPDDFDITREIEVYLVLSVDTTKWLGAFNITPSLAYFYNLNYDAHTIEAALSYSAPISKWVTGDEYLRLDTAIYYGYQHANKAAGDQRYNDVVWKNGYGYFGIQSDVVLSVTSYCDLSIGIRYAQHNDGADNDISGTQEHLWMGSKVLFKF